MCVCVCVYVCVCVHTHTHSYIARNESKTTFRFLVSAANGFLNDLSESAKQFYRQQIYLFVIQIAYNVN